MTRIAILCAVTSAFALVGLLYWNSSSAVNTATQFVADPNNAIKLSVLGWTQAELDRILGDFSRQYELPRKTMTVEAGPANILTVTFPNDIEPKLLFFLVNYIHYPNGFDLGRRTIGAVAHVVLTPAFGVPDPGQLGKRATIYVPANDSEYDLVYAQVESDRAYQISFTNLIWKSVADARVPAASRGL